MNDELVSCGSVVPDATKVRSVPAADRFVPRGVFSAGGNVWQVSRLWVRNRQDEKQDALQRICQCRSLCRRSCAA
jgi:hypothetical protein